MGNLSIKFFKANLNQLCFLQKRWIPKTGQSLKMSLVTFIVLFFIWCLVVENSLGQTADREAKFATELLKILEEGAKTQEKAKSK